MRTRLLRLWFSLCPVLLLGFALLDPQAPTAAAPPSDPLPDSARKVEPALLKQLLSDPDGSHRFIAHLAGRGPSPGSGAPDRATRRAALVASLQDEAIRTQSGVRALLAARAKAGAAADVRPFWIVNAVAARGNRETVLAIAALPEVAVVRADPLRQWLPVAPDVEGTHGAGIPEWNIAMIGADRVWNAFGFDGSGVVVANLDTGVDWQHPALMSRYRGYRGVGPPVHDGNWFDATGYGYVYPGDGYGHGTHTMGTIAGGEGIGVAPGARWIAAKIFDNQGGALDSWIHAGFEWLLAPAGDPALAPDIVSNSWGSDWGGDITFRDDVRVLRAAGMVVVFSNGNNGPNAGTVGSPASFPEAFAVGAIDRFEGIAYFSARGPSPFDERIKPDVSAPGVDVLSSAPGGGYRLGSGTSMAAPHVAGIAALMMQARPGLTLTETEYAITSTSLPISAPVPNNHAGWGRVSAYDAVLRVTAYGTLSGTVTSVYGPLAGAQVRATDGFSRVAQATTGANGDFQLPLPPGLYAVSASAFGYAPSATALTPISQSQTTVFNTQLAQLPSGTIIGRVRELAGVPLSASVNAAGTPAGATTDADGNYTLTMPIGTYTLRAESWGHRVLTATAEVQPFVLITRNFDLPAAPPILIVDSGAWYGASQAARYQSALDALGYLYHTHYITSPIGGAPSVQRLSEYSITLWSAPQDSPAYVGAQNTIKQYLDGGGRLFLSGQDIAFWDGGGSYGVPHYYFSTSLHARYLFDIFGSTARGIPGGALAGISVTLNTTDSAKNQTETDVVGALDEFAQPLMIYGNGDLAGLSVEACAPYRAAYLAFGLEGAGPRPAQQALLQGLITWLMASAPAHGLFVDADPQIAVGLPGMTYTHAFTIRNTGTAADSYGIGVAGNRFPTALLDQNSQPVTSTIALQSCERRTYSLRVTIPLTTPHDSRDVALVTVQSSGNPALVETRAYTTKTPAPVLLVDDDRWYPQEQKYFDALSGAGISYDVYDTRGAAGPPLAVLTRYPVVAWFSGYDWFDPLNASDEQTITAYLDGGGRLFYTSQDYLATRRAGSTVAEKYFGVLTFTNDVDVKSVSGVAGHPVGDGLGPFKLSYPFLNWSDYLTPTISASVAFAGNGVAPTGVSVRHPAGLWKTVFFGFPFETIPLTDSPSVMQSIVGWLSPLGDTALIAPRSVLTGATFTYQIVPHNAFPAYASRARITVTLPASVSLQALGNPSLVYDAPAHRIVWSGAPTTTAPLTFAVAVLPGVGAGAHFSATIAVHDTDEGILFTRRAWTFVERSRSYLPLVGR